MRQLVWWVGGWDKAGNPASRGKPFHKVSISNWRSAVLSGQQRSPRVPGLAFYVRRIQLIGRPTEGRAWGGVLLLIYERQTHSLFHYVAANDKTSSFPPGILWYALDKAASLLRDKMALSAHQTEKQTVFLPQGTNDEAAFSFFRDAEALLEKCGDEDGPLQAVTHANKQVEIRAEEWETKWYAGLAGVTLTVELESARDFRKLLMGMAANTASELKRLHAERGNQDELMPSWRGLNRPGTDPNWLAKRLKKRAGAALPMIGRGDGATQR